MIAAKLLAVLKRKEIIKFSHILNNPISTLFLEGTLAFVYTQFTQSLIIITFSVFLADKNKFNVFMVAAMPAITVLQT